MNIFCTLLLGLAVILDSFEMSLQSRRSPDEDYHSDSSPRFSVMSARERFPGVVGYKFEDLEFIRLRPYCSPNRVYELRKYVFPPDKPIGLRACPGVLRPIPVGEQIVLSTSGGDICAIMDKRGRRDICLRGLYISYFGKAKRARMNMNTGAIKRMTEDESDECPADMHDIIARIYAVSRVNTTIPHTGSTSHSRVLPDVDSSSGVHQSGTSPSSSSRDFSNRSPPISTSHSPIGSPTTSEAPFRERSRSPTLRRNFPIVLGYNFEDLESIRLTPHGYPDRIFELRIYSFPPHKPIGLITKHRVLNPIPTGDQIVLSASNGDIYAILHKKADRSKIFRPMFISNSGILERVKMNMNSGEVKVLSTEENAESPVTPKAVITNIYKVFHV